MHDIQGQTKAPPRGRTGRKARRAAGTQPNAPAYITRRIPTFELLGEEGLARLEDHAETILQEVGFEVREDEEAQRLFREAGADVKGERVRFPRGMLPAIIRASAPACFTQHARNPARNVKVGHPHTVFSPAYGSPFVQDMEGGRRYGTLADFENFVKLAWASPWLHHSGGTICEPVDIPVNKRHLDMVYAHMRWSDKGFMGSVTAAERAEDSVEMAKLLFGADFVGENTVLINLINANSPMTFDGTMLGALKVYARNNQATIVTPFILSGAMAPVTPVGVMTQTLAEALDEYRSANPVLKRYGELHEGSKQFFRSHDLVHLVFGCGVTLEDEAVADTWSLFGTTARMRDVFSYLTMEEHRELVRTDGRLRRRMASLRALPRVIRAVAASRRMTEPWPWLANERYLETPLAQIRAHFGIELV